MEESVFYQYLKKGGRSESAARRVIKFVQEFKEFLAAEYHKEPDRAEGKDLEAYVQHVEAQPGKSAKLPLWGIAYYYGFTGNQEMNTLASTLRGERISRKPFSLADFQGVDPDFVRRLAEVGVKNVKQMLRKARTPADRVRLAAGTRVPLEIILEYARLSDLARVPGLKGVRARLYHDAGVKTIQQLAEWDAEELRQRLERFVAESGFEGIAPYPAEVKYAVSKARSLPVVLEE